MENKNNNESIKEIAQLISEKANEEALSEEEFEFGKPKRDSGLVFEAEPTPDFKKLEREREAKEKIISDIADAERYEPPAPKEEEQKPEKSEFDVSKILKNAEKNSDDTPVEAQMPAIRTTYVPRFTEVSETYRMKDDPRRKKTLGDSATVTVESADEQEGLEVNPKDPTAEIENSVADTVIVRQMSAKEDEVETVNIYKFETEDEFDESEVAEEIAEIESLIGKSVSVQPVAEPEPSDEEAEGTEASEEVETEPTPEENDKHVVLPDPEPSELSVVDYSNSDENTTNIPAPEGVVELAPDANKSSSEFTHTTQRDSFKDKFLDSLMSVKIRMVAVFLFSLILLVYETLAAFGKLDGMFGLSFGTTTVGLCDLVFVLGLFALVLPEITRAIRHLFDGRVVSDMLLIPAMIAAASYSLVIAFSPTARNYVLVGFVFAVFVSSVILAAYFKLKGDFVAFKVISKVGEKKILDRKLTRELPEENVALDGLVEEYKSRTARIFRVGFVTDFFKRISKSSEDSKHILRMLIISFGAAFITGLICFFVPGGIVSAFAGFALVFLISCPAISLLSHKLPYHIAQQQALEEESTVVGEAAYHDFSEVDVVAFDDTDIFGPDDVNLKRFMLYGDTEGMEKAMQQMCSLFAVSGGPLKYIFENALDRRVRHTEATRVVIEDDGISGDVSGRRICAGTEEYMRRHGIAIPDGASKTESGIDTTKVMYAAEDGEMYARFHIRYSFSEEFTVLLPTLREEGIIPVIYTRDPNVSNELLRILCAGNDCMRVVKRTTPDNGSEMMYRNVSAGVVSYGDKINSINIVLLAKRYKKLIVRMKNIEMYAMGAGLGLGVLLSVLGMFSVPSFVFGLWQLAWCTVLGIAAHSALKK